MLRSEPASLLTSAGTLTTIGGLGPGSLKGPRGPAALAPLLPELLTP